MTEFPATDNSHPGNKQSQKLEGFDFLRAFFSIAIVALHSNLFSLKGLGSLFIAKTLAADVAYLAVPVFFQISLFLFYIKSEKLGSSYFIQKRLPKLISLYLFWVTSKIVFDILFSGKSEPLKNSTASFKGFIEFIISGGSSPLFFFFSLAFITALTEVTILSFRKIKNASLKKSLLYFLLIASCALIFAFSLLSLPMASMAEGAKFLKSASSFSQWDYNPLNFLPYIFTTAIAAQEFNQGKLQGWNSKLKRRIYTLISLCLIFIVFEWNLSQELLHYSRLSLVFGSWLLLYLALLSTHKVPATVQFISGCSLGIYTLHLFFNQVFFKTHPNILAPLSDISPSLAILLEFLIALSGSIFLTLLFRKVKFLKGFV